MNEQRCGAAWTMEDTLELSSNGWTLGLSRLISVEPGDAGSSPASSDENVLAYKYQVGSNPATASLFTFQPTSPEEVLQTHTYSVWTGSSRQTGFRATRGVE